MSSCITFKDEVGEDWDNQMNRKCKCGHLLYLHAFTMHRSFTDSDYMVLRTSQCTMCKYDYEKEQFVCEGFDPE